MTEEWKEIPGFESFVRVTSDGRVGILVVNRNGNDVMQRTPYFNEHGYHVVTLPLMHPKKKRHWLVHRLVMLAFVGECPEGMVVNHKNGIKHDNRLDNLEYCTYQENSIHARDVLGRTFGRKTTKPERLNRIVPHTHTKLDADAVRKIREHYANGMTMSDIAWIYGVSGGAIRDVIHRMTWRHVK